MWRVVVRGAIAQMLSYMFDILNENKYQDALKWPLGF